MLPVRGCLVSSGPEYDGSPELGWTMYPQISDTKYHDGWFGAFGGVLPGAVRGSAVWCKNKGGVLGVEGVWGWADGPTKGRTCVCSMHCPLLAGKKIAHGPGIPVCMPSWGLAVP